jgi:hypothetical protein
MAETNIWITNQYGQDIEVVGCRHEWDSKNRVMNIWLTIADQSCKPSLPEDEA